MHVNYTTYDLRHSSDTISLSAHPDVISLFHANVAYSGPRALTQTYQRINIAWVQHFQLDSSYSSGFAVKQPLRLKFMQQSLPGSFGFLDADFIICGSHLIPAFTHRKPKESLAGSVAQSLPSSAEKDNDDGNANGEDYRYYYANIFVN
ncbi:hypothetical protein A7U60_g5910 [Sanghuangporus baumii]|uniref:Uncharacterized protein n=1 Tax=Sanghuangporus baumii TaxID=108892 RepID=A0A9Q5N7U7_SANBA|nr:hypothetical protein A7U60_g5910 [Sanghuangporus baumii]